MEGTAASRFNVGGVWLDRPFKIRRLGHFGFNVRDIEACARFYTDLLGFSISDPIDFGIGAPRGAPWQCRRPRLPHRRAAPPRRR